MSIWHYPLAVVLWLSFTACNAASPSHAPNVVAGKTFTYCFNPGWRPYDYADNGQHQGIFGDYLHLLSKRLDITVVAHPTDTWTDALEAIKRGECDFLVGAVKTTDREQYLDFTAPYFEMVHVLIAKPDRPFIGTLSSLSGKMISGPKSGAIMQWIARDYPSIQHHYVETAKEAMATITEGRVYAHVTPLDALVSEYGWMLRDLKIIGKLDYPYPISIAVRKGVPDLREAFDTAIVSLSHEERSEISKRWTTFTLVEEIDYTRLWLLLGVSVLLLTSFAFWNRRLRQEVSKRMVVERQLLERTASLSEALEFNESMLLNTPVPMGIYAEGGQCILANEAYTQFVGATQEQLLAQNFYEIPSWKTTSLLGDCLTALKLQTFQQREAHVITSFGKDVWFEYRILPRHLKGQVHLLIQFLDLTERKAQQLELERRVVARTAELATAKAEAESANAVKTRFMANVSHEMRTPMNGILGFADIGKRKIGKASDDVVSGYFDKILDSGRRLNKLTESLLSLAQDAVDEQSEIKDKDLVMFEPESLAIQAITLMEATAASRQQKIILENTSTNPMLLGDESRLRQVLEHLLSNALRYSPEQTIVTITIQDAPAFAAPPKMIFIKVIDQGCGIPPKELNAIFEPFYESSRTATGAGGTGLGLALSKSIIQRHKGTMTASNRPEGGSIFEVTLPLLTEV